MAKPADIIAEIAAALPQPKKKTWHERVAAEHVATLDAIIEAYTAGKFGSAMRPAAEAIAATLKARGIADIGQNGVTAWLRANAKQTPSRK